MWLGRSIATAGSEVDDGDGLGRQRLFIVPTRSCVMTTSGLYFQRTRVMGRST